MVEFYLRTANINNLHIDKILTSFSKIIINNVSCIHDPVTPIMNLSNKYKGMIWLPIDKNARRIAAICPVRLYDEINNYFINDKKHFTVMTDVANDVIEVSFVKTIQKQLNKKWLFHTWSSKKKKLSNLSLTIKMDGVRFRPLGMYHLVPHKPLLSYAASSLAFILENSGLKTFTLFRSKDLKQLISDFDIFCHTNDLHINFATFDIKNFFTEVQTTVILPRLKFVLDNYVKTNHTQYISVPKHKNKYANIFNPVTKPHCGRDFSSFYYTFSMDMLYDIIVFAINNAYFRVGSYILKQSDGLPQGDPISPLMAIIYVAIDEHVFNTVMRSNLSTSTDIYLLLIRYADDLLRCIASRIIIDEDVAKIDDMIKNDLYERDITSKNLLLIKSEPDELKYLDADVIVYDNSSRIKIIYHNKNSDIIDCNYQTVGRLHDMNDYLHIKTKTNAFANMLIRVSDYTTYEIDYIKPALELMYEMSLLSYEWRHMYAAFRVCFNARRSNIWLHIARLTGRFFNKKSY